VAGLATLPGVYRMLDEQGRALYVGKAKNLKKRVGSYFQKKQNSPRIAHMLSQVAAIETTSTSSEADALLLESNLIKTLSPRYNILFRDDKSYPYISLSRQNFPQLAFFRGKPNKRADCYGPFPSGGAVRESLQLLQKTFQLRTCEDSVFGNRSRPCLLHQIKRCSAPCVGKVSQHDYAADVHMASLFLQGKARESVERLRYSMESAASRLDFETAARYRDQLVDIQAITSKQFVDSGKSEDLDVIVAVCQHGELCVNMAMIRNGRYLGDKAQFPALYSAAGQVSAAEALAAFLRQHYATHPVPGSLLCSPRLPVGGGKKVQGETDDTASLLAELSGRPVHMLEARALRHKAWLKMTLDNAMLSIVARNKMQERQHERLAALADVILPSATDSLRRIECFDISHSQGEATVASCVVYVDGGMKNGDYRRYNIRDIKPGDDYAALRQVIGRRFASFTNAALRSQLLLPDLLLVDGGKGQLSAVCGELAELGLSLNVVGVAKGEGRKAGLEHLVFSDGRKPMRLAADNPALHLIQEIRDEAHRFAIVGHRARRGKARRASSLERIPGVGAARRKRLLAHFGGISGVVDATIDQLASVTGISVELAERIYAGFHS